MSPWSILGISATNNKKDIKRAYIRLLKECHPEEDQEGFIQLRSAFEQANILAEYDVDEDFLEEHEAESTPKEKEIVEDVVTDLDSEGAVPSHVDDFFDSFASYSEINVQKNSNSELFDEIDFDGEYQQCIDELDSILLNFTTAGVLESWQKLFNNKILVNYNYRQYFCSILLSKIKEHLEIYGEKNSFTPEIILLISDCINGSNDTGGNHYLSDNDVFNIYHLAESAKKINDLKKINKKSEDKVSRLLWLFFSFKGRLSILHFSLSFFSLIVVVMTIGNLISVAMADSSSYSGPKFISESLDVLNTEEDSMIQEELNIGGNEGFLKKMAEEQFKLDGKLYKNKTYEEKEKEKEKEKTVDRLNNILNSERYKISHSIPPNKPANVHASKKYTENNSWADTKSPSKKINQDYFIPMIILYAWIMLALMVKRLHDTGRSMSSALIIFLPYIGMGVILYYLFSKSEKMDNKYGEYMGAHPKDLIGFRKLVFILFFSEKSV